MVAAASGAGLLLTRAIGTSGADMLYLLPVLAAAILYGLRHGLVASFSSALAYNFFFTEPLHSFRIAEPANILTVLILLVVAIVTSQLAGRMRRLTGLALQSATLNATLVGFARQLLACGVEREVSEVLCREAGRLFGVNAIFLSRAGGSLRLVASEPRMERLNSIDEAAAAAAVEEGETCGRGAQRHSAADWTFYPLLVADRTVGTLGLARDDGREPVGPESMPLLDSMLDQGALALERARLESEMLDVAQLRERDRLREGLLSSVGHDLRTPLTFILASTAELRRRASDGGDDALLATLEAEARRLDRLIANLLDMARVEAGAIRLNLEAIDLTDAVNSAVQDVRPSLAGNRVETDVPADLPFVRADPQLLHHCLINLLDNAGRHSRSGSVITISGRLAEAKVELTVADEGAGIPPGMEEAIFERFTRLEGSDRKGGTGVGLAIVKAFAEAMKIEVRAGNRPDGAGAQFILRFPEVLVVPANVPAAFG